MSGAWTPATPSPGHRAAHALPHGGGPCGHLGRRGVVAGSPGRRRHHRPPCTHYDVSLRVQCQKAWLPTPLALPELRLRRSRWKFRSAGSDERPGQGQAPPGARPLGGGLAAESEETRGAATRFPCSSTPVPSTRPSFSTRRRKFCLWRRPPARASTTRCSCSSVKWPAQLEHDRAVLELAAQAAERGGHEPAVVSGHRRRGAGRRLGRLARSPGRARPRRRGPPRRAARSAGRSPADRHSPAGRT